jgi:hypothetical protein
VENQISYWGNACTRFKNMAGNDSKDCILLEENAAHSALKKNQPDVT